MIWLLLAGIVAVAAVPKAKVNAATPAVCSARAAGGTAARAWDSIDKECRKKLEKNKTSEAFRCLDGHFLEGREPGRRAGDWFTTLRKLRHDTEMFTYLEGEGKIKPELKRLYKGIFNSARDQREHKPDKVFEVQFQEENDDRDLFKKSHNKAVWIDPSGKERPQKTIRQSSDKLKTLEDAYVANGYAHTDAFLTDKAFKSLRKYLISSTFYFYQRPGYHLAALLEDGLASPLLAQIVDGLKHALPNVLGHLPLTGVRAYKADNSPLPIASDASISPALGDDSASAAVSLLLWTVSAKHLNDPETAVLLLRNRTSEEPEAEADAAVEEVEDEAKVPEEEPPEEVSFTDIDGEVVNFKLESGQLNMYVNGEPYVSEVHSLRIQGDTLFGQPEEWETTAPEGQEEVLQAVMRLWTSMKDVDSSEVVWSNQLESSAASGPQAARVLYKANRLVMWGPGAEPEFVSAGWKKGFEERGIHLLFNFGWSGC